MIAAAATFFLRHAMEAAMTASDGTVGDPRGGPLGGKRLLVEVVGEGPRAAPAPRGPRWWRERSRLTRVLLKLGVAALVAGTVAKWTVVPTLVHEIDTDVAFEPIVAPEGGSAAVAITAALIDREVNTHRWVPNDPWFMPTDVLDNMPNFQQGVLRASSWFTLELLDQIGRVRGPAGNDRDLERAAGLLQFPPDVWVIDPETSLLPSATSEDQYRAALTLLKNYNDRVAEGRAVFELRADALATTLRRMSVDLGAQAAEIDRMQDGAGWMLNRQADDLFYANKGMLYAYRMILGGLGSDFESIVAGRGIGNAWAQVLADLERGAQLRPAVVLNADSDTSVFANHLMLQGFYMKRAILQLEEVVNTLAV